ncbi:MAG: hypothetical protein MPJ24_00150 [Pirellulaceae bacterium]|nr:hypothetical protein [Pirellulaceae bacterium]
MTQPTQRETTTELPTTSESPQGQPSRQTSRIEKIKRQRRRILRGSLSFTIFFLLLYLAPSILSFTPLPNYLLQSSLPIAAKGRAGSFSLGWFSPVTLTNIKLTTEDGSATLVTIRQAKTENSLLTLLTDQTNLGTIILTDPQISITVEQGSSDLEELLKPLWDQESTDSKINLDLLVQNGSLMVAQKGSNEKWQLNQIAAELTYDPTQENQLHCVVEGKTVLNKKFPSQNDYGTFAATIDYHPRSDAELSTGASHCTVAFDSTDVNLGLLDPIVHRYVSTENFPVQPLPLAGHLTAVGKYELLTNGKHQIVFTPLRSSRIHYQNPSFAAEEKIAIQNFDVQGDFIIDTEKIEITSFEAVADLGNVSASGSFPLNFDDYTKLLQTLSEAQATGQVNLATLSKAIPKTLLIQEGLEITDGQLLFSVAQQASSQKFTGQVALKNIEGIDKKQSVSSLPAMDASVTFDLSQELRLDNLALNSPFLQANGGGNIKQGLLRFSGDLNKLKHEMSPILNLPFSELQGDLNGAIQWDQNDQSHLAARAELVAQNFHLASEGQRPWKEEKLIFITDAQMKIDNDDLTSDKTIVDKLTVKVASGNDQLSAVLFQSLPAKTLMSEWPFQIEATGNLATFADRIPFVEGLKENEIGGNFFLTGRLQASPEQLATTNLKVEINEGKFTGYGLTINEPKIVLEGDLSYLLQSQRVSAEKLSLTGNSLALLLDRTSLPVGDPSKFTGNLQFNLNVWQISNWFEQEGDAPWRGAGALQGALNSFPQGDSNNFNLALHGENLQLVEWVPDQNSWKTLWQEPLLQNNLEASYSPTTGKWTLSKLEGSTIHSAMNARGSLTPNGTTHTIDLQGNILYNLQKLSPNLQQFLATKLELVGERTDSFSIQGDLPYWKEVIIQPSPSAITPITSSELTTRQIVWPDNLTASGKIGWQKVAVQGFTINEGEFGLALQKGIIATMPLKLQVNGGELTTTATFDLGDPILPLTLATGKLFTDIEITPEMCQNWLQYATPIVAEATRANGRFSLDVQKAMFALSDSSKSEVAATLEIHQGRVGPGPVAQEITTLISQINQLSNLGDLNQLLAADTTWLLLPPQKVPIQMINEIVTHRNFVMQVQGITVQTQGSVTLDKQINLLVEFLVPPKWANANRALANLQNQRLALPLTGTLLSPQIDKRGIQQLLQSTLQKTVDDQIKKGIDKLLNKIKKPA